MKLKRHLVVCGVAALLAVGCAGFRPVERGDWRRVYAKDVTERTSTAKQEIIPRDQWEAEVADGYPRTWKPPPGYEPPFLKDSPKLGLEVGDVMELRVDEAHSVELLLNGGVVDLYWTEAKKVDGWKDGHDITSVQSTLFLVGRKPGTAVLRFVANGQPKDVPITVAK